MCGFVVAQHDDCVEADSETEDRSILLGPLLIRSPWVLLGQLMDVANQWQTRRSGWEAFVLSAVMLTDDQDCQCEKE